METGEQQIRTTCIHGGPEKSKPLLWSIIKSYENPTL